MTTYGAGATYRENPEKKEKYPGNAPTSLPMRQKGSYGGCN